MRFKPVGGYESGVVGSSGELASSTSHDPTPKTGNQSQLFVTGERVPRTKASGSTTRPRYQTSKCTCGPVERPVEPTSEITSPACTRSPTCASSLLLCA